MSYQQHPGITAEFPGVVLEIDQVSPIAGIEELIQDENIIPAEAIANSFIPGVDTTAPRQSQSWADVFINRPTTPGVGSHHQSKLKIDQAINTSDNTQEPPSVLSAEKMEDAYSGDDDADSDDDKTSREGNSNSNSDGEDNNPHDGSGNDTHPPDTWCISQRRRDD